MILIENLEVHPSASEAEVPTDALMEGELTEEQSMSPLHQEELGGWDSPVNFPRGLTLRIVEETGEELMTSVLDKQPLLRVVVSGQCCI